MAVPGDEIAAGPDGPGLRAPQADREQVLDALKDAFVQGRLTRDEFDARVARALATYAELDALTCDIPAGPPGPAGDPPGRESHNRKVMQRGTAAGAGISMAFATAMVIMGGLNPVVGLIIVSAAGVFIAVLLAGLLTLLSWALEKGSGRCAARRRAPRPRPAM